MSLNNCVRCGLILLTLALAAFQTDQGPLALRPAVLADSSGTQQPQRALSLPAKGESDSQTLSVGQSYTYALELEAGEYLRASLESNGPSVVATIRDSTARVFSQSYCRSNDVATISMVAEGSDHYWLEVHSPEKTSWPGSYKLKLEEVRPATSRDRHVMSAERSSAEAQQLLTEWRGESSRRAIEKFKDSLASWRQAGDTKEEAHTLKHIGEVYQPLGEYTNALDYYDQALVLSRKKKDRTSEAETLNAICSVHITLGNNQKALGLCSRALRLIRAVGDRREEAQALNNLGEVHYGFGKRQASIEFYRQALPIWRELQDREGQALTLLNFGYTYSDLGQMQEALDFYNQAYPLWTSVDNRRGEALTLSALGRLESRLGESQKALNSFAKAMQLIEQLGDPIWKAATLTGMAYTYQGLGDDQLALKYYNDALVLFRAGKNVPGEANTLYDIAGVYYSSKEYQRALDYYQHCLSIGRAGDDKWGQSYAVRGIGMVYQALGEEAKAMERYSVARLFYHHEKDLRGEADVLNLLGQVFEHLGAKPKALESYQNALSLNGKAGYRVGEAATLYNIAHLLRSDGKIDECRKQMEAALQVVESLRTNVDSHDLRSTYLASTHQQFEYYIDVLMELHKQRPTEGFDSFAFDASERARARSLLELLRDSRRDVRDGADASLLELERATQKLIEEKTDQQKQFLAQNNQGDAETLTKEIDRLVAENSELRVRINATSSRYPTLAQPQPLSVRDIQQQVLDDHTLLLEYSLGDERSYVWAVTRSEVSSFELPGRAEIERAAREVHTSLIANQPLPDETFQQRQSRIAKANDQLPSQIANLSRILLAPVAARLGTKRLLIIPDGVLQYIPFQILNKATEPKPLVVDHEIVNEPSASTLALLVTDTKTRKTPARSVAVLADPVFEADDPRIASAANPVATSVSAQETELHRALRDVSLSGEGSHIPRLQASRDEADAIMSVTPWRSGFQAVGFEASRATVMKADLSNYRIVHFATHGLLNNEHPELSGIVLSLFDQKGLPQDGFLRLHDIYNLKLPVDLVVLSACNTGLGKDVKGEGLIGLTRGFMYAGASSVVASLWKVDDEATAELMRLFYGYMLRDGLSPAAALRKAQVTMSQRKRWQSPYYWAGFVIQGQYIPSERLSCFPIHHVALWLIATALVSAAAFYALRRRRKIIL